MVELEDEARLHRLPKDEASTDDLWQTDFPGGHLVVAQHNDGSYSCSTLIFGVGAETVVAAVERDLVLSGLPESMRFQLTDFVEKDGVADHHYRQAGDAKMSATLTVMLGEPRIDDDRAVLTFFYETRTSELRPQ